MTHRTRKEHTMKRLAVTVAVVAGVLGVAPAIANGADRAQVAKPAVAKPAVFRTAVFRSAVYRQALLGRSLQVVRVHGL